jgi:hypothetical protein
MLLKVLLNIIMLPINIVLLPFRIILKILFFRNMTLWTVVMADKGKRL